MDNMNPADIKALLGDDGEGWGGGWFLIVILFLFMFGFGNNSFGNRQGEFSQYATAASQDQILLGQRFDALSAQINQVGDGLCSSTFALNNTIVGEGRAIQTQLADCCCNTQRAIDNVRYDNAQNTQKVLDAITGNRMADMQNQINSLQLQAALCGIPRITNYAYGVTPLNWCNAAPAYGCGCNVGCGC